MTVLANNISGFIPSQVPQYILDQYPNFVAILQAYFQFLEDTNFNGTIYQIRKLQSNQDVDTAEEEFLQFFQNDFLPYFPLNPALDLRKLLKVATKFYQTKGSQNSIEFLFRVLYGLDSQIFYPKQNILKASDGKWQLPQSIKLVLTGTNTVFDVSELVGRQGIGSASFSTCVIEAVNLTIDPTLNREVVECFLSNVSAPFTPGEQLIVNVGNDQFGVPIIFRNSIVASISDIKIDPLNPGLKYRGTSYYSNGSINYPGDPVSIIGGLASANDIIQAVAYVGNVTQGSVTGIAVQDGGYGFRLEPNTIIGVIDAPGDTTGAGANIIVNGVDTTNQVFLLLNTDSIAFKQNVVIGNTTYQFANNTSANLLSVLGNTFTYANLSVAPITSMNVVFGGSGYTQTPSLNLQSVFDTDYSQSLYAVYLASPTTANWLAYQAAKSRVKDLGRVAAIEVLAGGSGYSNVTDKIYINTEVGYGSSFDFITVAGTITRVIVTNSGFGFQHPMAPVYVANSANASNSSAGSGAQLTAFGDSEDAIFSISVSSIGRILDFRLTNRGFDYLTTPLVSLRNEDVKIQAIPSNQFYFQGDTVFQGANANSATFTAFVDSYDRSNNILRLYNYIGAINLSSTLQGSNQNATPISVTIYGNGKARANAEFFGGLIDYPGFWLNSDGFLSADQRLEDGTTYHNYSYIIKVEKELTAYSDTIKKIAHPAGMKMLGLMTVTDNKTDIIALESETIQTMNTANVTGNITINAFTGGNGFVTGLSTHFVGNVKVGDLFLISSNIAGRAQAKAVTGIINNIALYVESNTMYFSTEMLKTTTGSNVVVSTPAVTNIGIGDIFKTNIAGNAQTSLVAAVALGGNSITVNTVFSSNNTNVEFQVWPVEANVAYMWFSPA